MVQNRLINNTSLLIFELGFSQDKWGKKEVPNWTRWGKCAVEHDLHL